MSRSAVIAWAAVLLVCTTAASAKHAPEAYRLTDLGDLTSDGKSGVTFSAAITDKGEIVGQSFDDQFRPRAFIWSAGRMTDLGVPLLSGPSAVEAISINKRLQIVGNNMPASGGSKGFIWQVGVMTQLGTLLGTFTDTLALGINGRGEIVGAGFSSDGQLHGIQWVLGMPKALPSLSNGRFPVQAFDINEHGQIVGYLSPGGQVAFARAFLYDRGKYTELGTLPGTTLSLATAINDKGQVIGQSLNTSKPGTARAFLWEKGSMQDLGTVLKSHIVSEPRDINKDGTVVGSSGNGVTSTPWIWSEGLLQNLNKLIAVDDPNKLYVRLTVATGINSKGQIAATGYDRRSSSLVRGYLLTPATNSGKK